MAEQKFSTFVIVTFSPLNTIEYKLLAVTVISLLHRYLYRCFSQTALNIANTVGEEHFT